MRPLYLFLWAWLAAFGLVALWFMLAWVYSRRTRRTDNSVFYTRMNACMFCGRHVGHKGTCPTRAYVNEGDKS